MSQCSRGIYPLFQSHIVWQAYAFCDLEHILVWKCDKVVARWYHVLDPHQLLVFSCLQNEPQDLLFILTARYRVFILSYKPETGDIVTRACGDVQVFTSQRSSCLQGEVGTFISQYLVLGYWFCSVLGLNVRYKVLRKVKVCQHAFYSVLSA